MSLSNRTCQTNKKHKDSTSENISTHCTRRDPHFQANSRRRKLLHLIMPHVPLSSSAHRGISSTKRQHQGHALIYIDFFFFLIFSRIWSPFNVEGNFSTLARVDMAKNCHLQMLWKKKSLSSQSMRLILVLKNRVCYWRVRVGAWKKLGCVRGWVTSVLYPKREEAAWPLHF